jgi:hypothetical protein
MMDGAIHHDERAERSAAPMHGHRRRAARADFTHRRRRDVAILLLVVFRDERLPGTDDEVSQGILAVDHAADGIHVGPTDVRPHHLLPVLAELDEIDEVGLHRAAHELHGVRVQVLERNAGDGEQPKLRRRGLLTVTQDDARHVPGYFSDGRDATRSRTSAIVCSLSLPVSVRRGGRTTSDP